MPGSIRILLVDDDAEIRRIMREALEIQGLGDVVCACNGLEAVQMYQDFLPHLVFMDIVMPVMDGYEASRRIKAMDPDAQIVVLTGNPADPRARRIIDEGIVPTVFQKPLRLSQIRSIIEARVCCSSPSPASPTLLSKEQPAFEPRL